MIADEDDEAIEATHSKLLTPLGRFIDGFGYSHVAIAAAITLLMSTSYFYLASGTTNGIVNSSGAAGKTIGEALYFSVITFTTVGYGDLTPVGWGRAVASVEVLVGLALTALLIGKIASERQSAMLLLLYTSDQQRRIANFAAELRVLATGVSGEPTISLNKARAGAQLLRSLRAYLIFQSHQGRLADFGNGSALRNLYRAMFELQDAINQGLRTLVFHAEVEGELLKIVSRVDRLAEVMAIFHKANKSASSALRAIASKTKEIDSWVSSAVTFRRLEQVIRLVPAKPWPKHFHKEAADSLGISHKLFRRCMDELIALGKL